MDAIESSPTLEAVLLTTSNAIPGGVVTRDAVQRLTTPILEGIAREKPDAVVLALHGAMVTEDSDDGEEYVGVVWEGSGRMEGACIRLKLCNFRTDSGNS